MRDETDEAISMLGQNESVGNVNECLLGDTTLGYFDVSFNSCYLIVIDLHKLLSTLFSGQVVILRMFNVEYGWWRYAHCAFDTCVQLDE